MRLGKRFWGLDAQHTCADVIAADPGVKALVGFVRVAAATDQHAGIRHEADAALKLWEDGLEQSNLRSIEDSVAEHGDA